MKCISWNVNGLRSCMTKGFKEFFESSDSDIFALQETKMQPSQLDETMQFDGYHMYMNSAERKGYSGTLVYAKKEPLSVQYEIEGDITKEGRVITLEYESFYFVCAYVPNSKEKLARLEYRVEWEQLLRNHLTKLNETKPVIYCGDLKDSPSGEIPKVKKKPIIYCGDLNVAFSDLDIKNPVANHHNPGFTDEERAEFGKLLDSGFVDSYRYLYPDKEEYSWWSYRFNARARNAGWRIDYFLTSDFAKDLIVDSKIHTDVLGSDHCPIELDIKL